MRRPLLCVVAVAVVAGCGGSDQPAASLPQGSEPANLDPADFVAQIDNEYWPMPPGAKWVYREGKQKVEVTVTGAKEEILGIAATVVHDVVTENGNVVEDTWDWYAQDDVGNVWYLGEDTKEYENGKVTSTEGSWQAGVDGAEAGVVVPARPRAGMTYRQEYYRGEAEDAAKVLGVDERAQVPFGSFEHVLMTKDYTPREPDFVEHKFYAKDVGPVLTISVSGGSDREELVRYEQP